MTDAKKAKRRLNVLEKRELKAARLANHIQAVGRKAQKGMDPNDRSYDPDFDKALRRVSPLEIDALISFRDDEIV